MVWIILTALVLIAGIFLVQLIRTAIARGAFGFRAEGVVLGAITNFFDTLGIGAFAPSTAWIKFRQLVPDHYIPAVLNTGHALPAVTQALVFITLVKVDVTLLIGCIISAVAGAMVGARIVQRMPLKTMQGIVGIALLIAATLFAAKNLNLLPSGGAALALPAGLTIAAFAAHFAMGALMTAGIGLYAPSLAFLSILGLDPIAAFPIMMGCCAFLMPSSGFAFIKSERIDYPLVLSMALGGIPAVLVAAFIVKEMPMDILRWLVVAVVLYAAVIMLRASLSASRDDEKEDIRV
jgi:uncharacterized membrane protein YfcA